MQKRIQYIDLAKGLCILLVVLYHVIHHFHCFNDFVRSWTCFLMPLFFFLSGLFFRENEGFTVFFFKKVNKLLIPFAFFYLVTSWALSNLLHYAFDYTVLFKVSLGISGLWAFITQEKFANDPIWFIWVLFLVNIYFYLLFAIAKRITTNKKYLPLVLAVMSFVVGIIGSAVLSRRINLLAFLDSAMSALPLFAIGFILNKYTNILDSNKWDKYLPLFVIVFFAIVYFFGEPCSYRVNRFHNNPFWQYICGVSGTLGIIFLAKIIRHIPFVTYWGRYSIMILVTHSMVLKVIAPLVLKAHLPMPLTVTITFIVLMFSYQLLIPLMKKFLPHVTGQKDVIDVSKFVNSNKDDGKATIK